MTKKPTYEALEKRNRELENRLHMISLTANQNHYRKILDCSPSVIYTKDLEGRYTSINKEFETLSGLKSEDVLGKTDFELFPTQVAENSTKNDKQVIQEGTPKEIEEHGPVNGQMHTFISTKYPLTNNDGEVYGICGVSTDITDRKHTETKLTNVESDLKNTFDLAPFIIAKANLMSGYFVEINPVASELLGYSADELTSKPIFEFIHPEDRHDTMGKVQSQIGGKRVEYFTNRYICKDGSYKWMAWYGTPVDEKGEIIAIGIDINNLKETERSLRATQETFDAIMDNAPAVIYLVNQDNIMVDINRVWEKIFKTQKMDVIGKSIYEIFPQKTADQFAALNRKVFEAGKTIESVENVPQEDGTHQYISLKFPLPETKGRLKTLCGISTDITERVKAEKVFQSQAQRLERIANNMFDMVALSDLEGNFTFAGKSHERILGYSASELIGKNVMDYVHPDDLPKVAQEFKTFLISGGLKTAEYRYQHKKGHYLWFETIGELLRDESDTPTEIIFSTRDITEHKRIENELKISEQKFRSLAENVPGLVLKYKLNPDGSDELLYISRSVEDIFEVSQEDAFKNNKLLWDRIHEDDLEEYTASIKISAEKLSLWEQEHRIRLPDGRVKWLFTRGFPNEEDDGSILWDTIALDVTEQKRIEALLKENEHRYKSAQRMGNVGNWEYDLVTETFWGSDQAKLIYGFDPKSDRFTTEDVENCIPERERVHQALIDLIENGTPYNLEFDIHPISGHETRTIRSIAEIIRDESGVPLKVVGVIQDITEQKKSLEQKERLEKELIQSQKMESIGTMAGGIAHEFNNILSIIIGNNELVMEELPEWSLSKENCREIHSAGLRARDIVRHLLTFSRQDVSTQKPTDVKSVVKDSLKLIRATTPTNIEIRNFISPECLPIFGDATQINQIMINLCSNAVYALPISGGRIDIQLGNTEIEKDPGILASKLEPGKYVKIEVRDNGSGMDKEILDRIFEPYFTTKDVGEGSGIGLSVVHGIVKKHSGSVVCESTKGQGTIFTILIPAYDGPVTEETIKQDLLPGKGEKILYVDDEPAIAELGRRHLVSIGYEAHSTTDPTEALKMIKAEPERFDLVITDMAMPNMPGDQLISEILTVNPGMPTIICTGYSSRMSEIKASEMGVKAFVMKPLNKAELAETVRQILDHK